MVVPVRSDFSYLASNLAATGSQSNREHTGMLGFVSYPQLELKTEVAQ